MSQVREDELHPDGTDTPELQASPPRKGRPTTSKTLRRNKSAFEYNRSSSRSCGSRFHHARDLVVDQRNHRGINFSFNLSGTCLFSLLFILVY